jgi:hypothetical protein
MLRKISHVAAVVAMTGGLVLSSSAEARGFGGFHGGYGGFHGGGWHGGGWHGGGWYRGGWRGRGWGGYYYPGWGYPYYYGDYYGDPCWRWWYNRWVWVC